ncbi:MAG TPA: hypothetical protein VKB03_02140 [Conexibacter sp.]|nr:hypothetical protein [Conexibacter sp.]
MRRRMRTMWKRALKRKREEAERLAAVSPRQGPDGPTTGSGQGGVDPDAEAKLIAHERPQGVVDPRTKNSGHGQKTADKWNQGAPRR